MLRIKDWIERFEAAREKDRPRKPMDWVRLPCDLQSTGYGTLMSGPSGAQHFGVFIALAEIVADLPIAFRDGSLVNPQGVPLSAQALSIKTRIPVETVEQSIAALKDCGWLLEEAISGVSRKLPENPGDSRQFLENPGGEGEGEGDGDGDGDLTQTRAPRGGAPISGSSSFRGRKHHPATQQQEEWFRAWFGVYWLNKDRARALDAFCRNVKDEETFNAVMAATCQQSAEMLRKLSTHRPYAATWLDGRRWLDGPTAARPDAYDEAAKL
jgi:hypothetical protein